MDERKVCKRLNSCSVRIIGDVTERKFPDTSADTEHSTFIQSLLVFAYSLMLNLQINVPLEAACFCLRDSGASGTSAFSPSKLHSSWI